MRTLLFALAILIVPSIADARAPKALWVRHDLTAEQLEADGKTCLDEAKAAERNRRWTPPNTNGVAGAMVGGMMKGFSDMERFMAAHEACGARLGYVEKPLTEEQRRAYDALKTKEERTRFHLAFSAASTVSAMDPPAEPLTPSAEPKSAQ